MRNALGRAAAAAALTIALAALLAAPAAGVEIALATESPLLDDPVAVTVTDAGTPVAGARVDAHYRPNSQTAFREPLPPTDAAGRTEWTPRAAGIVTLEVLEPAGGPAPGTVHRCGPTPRPARCNTAVRFGAFPARGVVVMVVAGLLLFGGAALGMAMLLREGPPAVEPPST